MIEIIVSETPILLIKDLLVVEKTLEVDIPIQIIQAIETKREDNIYKKYLIYLRA